MEGAGCYLACHMGVKDMNELSSLKASLYGCWRGRQNRQSRDMDKKEDVRKLGPYIEPKYHTQKSSTTKLRQLEKYVTYCYMLLQKQMFVQNLSEVNTFLSLFF